MARCGRVVARLGDDESVPDEVAPDGTVDWNSEWAKFQEGGMRSMAPKGREPLSKEAIATQKAKLLVGRVTNSVPTKEALFRDWRFWAAIILTLSLFTAFVNSSAQPAVTPGLGQI